MTTTSTVARPTKLAHLVIRTARYDEMVEWWCNLLGAHVVHGDDGISFLTYDDEHHRLAIIRNETVGDEARSNAGLEHVAFTYDGIDDLVSTYERLRDQGIHPILPINHGMTVSLYYQDPDANQAELQVDVLSPAESAEFMATDTFEANPIGVVFDPEEMAAQHRAGVPVDALSAYGPTAESK